MKDSRNNSESNNLIILVTSHMDILSSLLLGLSLGIHSANSHASFLASLLFLGAVLLGLSNLMLMLLCLVNGDGIHLAQNKYVTYFSVGQVLFTGLGVVSFIFLLGQWLWV